MRVFGVGTIAYASLRLIKVLHSRLPSLISDGVVY